MASVADHLWQSTLFVGAAALLTLAFRHSRASVRHGIWFAASLKFLVPFALLMAVGGQLDWGLVAHRMAFPELSSAVVQVSQPFDAWSPAEPSTPPHSATLWAELAMFSLWLGGVLSIAVARLRLWRRVKELARSGAPSQIPDIAVPAQLEVRSVPGMMEPGVIGWRRPVLMMPAGIADYLTGPQLEAVVVHELCHLRRRDNLTAGVHMVVEALFWFHPLVWWVGARMVNEREKACDEAVLSHGIEPSTYAEAILNVCKRYVAVPLASVSGVSGADLRRRLESIVAHRIGARVGIGGGVALALSLMAAIACPIVVGALERPQAREMASPAFDAASIKRNLSADDFADGGFHPGGRITAVNVTLANLMTAAYAIAPDRIEGGPAWVRRDRFDVVASANRMASVAETRQMLRALLAERFALVATSGSRERPVFELTTAARDGQPGPQLRPTSPECAAKRVELESAPPEGPPNPADPPCGRGVAFGGGLLSGRAVNTGQIAASLSGLVGRPVINRSRLDGLYDFELRFSRQGSNPGPTDPPEIVTALREQLGFRLEGARGPVEVLVIVSAAQPTVD